MNRFSRRNAVLQRVAGGAVLIGVAAAALAQTAVEPAASAPAAALPSAAPASAPIFEGAIGPLLSVTPEYSGASARKVGVTPGFYLRWGRWTVSNAGGFRTRRDDDVARGLALDVGRDSALRASLALRIDNGRRSDVSGALAGIDDVRRTLRLRGTATWLLGGGWKLGAGLSSDLLGRGGGQIADFGIGHDQRLSPRLTWSVGSGVSWGSSRYMRSWYGVSPDAALRSGYAVYTPGSGLREVSVGTGFRVEINPRWVAFGDASASRLLGPARDSPLTGSPRQWSVGGGVAYRF